MTKKEKKQIIQEIKEANPLLSDIEAELLIDEDYIDWIKNLSQKDMTDIVDVIDDDNDDNDDSDDDEDNEDDIDTLLKEYGY